MALKRVWIQMPQEIYDAAEKRRKKLYLPSFTEYVRSLIRQDLAETAPDVEAQPVDVKALARALANEEGG